jgi:hypothetical protein
MKRSQSSQTHGKFNANLRHYHRFGTQNQSSWDDWVDGPSAKPKSTRNWLKISAAVFGVLALGGIAAGLWIEMM